MTITFADLKHPFIFQPNFDPASPSKPSIEPKPTLSATSSAANTEANAENSLETTALRKRVQELEARIVDLEGAVTASVQTINAQQQSALRLRGMVHQLSGPQPAKPKMPVMRADDDDDDKENGGAQRQACCMTATCCAACILFLQTEAASQLIKGAASCFIHSLSKHLNTG